MAGQLFALIVGIDKYKSGTIWNLNAAVDDAKSISGWLINDLQVPRKNICVLLDNHATKHNIEEAFMRHLVNNPAIEPDDAILFYYAGHGSSIRAPPGWFDHGRGDVSVLCTYDYDTKPHLGHTNTGISDRSLHAMLQDLSRVKGDNITLILDTCFYLPPANADDPKQRRYTRYTPTRKATSDDLLSGLWRSATPHKSEPIKNRGFTGMTFDSHVVLAASSAGWAATERKDGGNFTRAFLTLKDTHPIHKFSYSDFPAELAPFMGDHQYAACAGANADRVLFDGVPFTRDTRFVSASVHDKEHMLVDAGAMQGVSVGTEFILHTHNRRGSLNASLGTFLATQVYPTLCLARPKTPAKQPLRDGWARVTRWNSPTPFRVHVKPSFFHFFRRTRLVHKLPSRPADVSGKPGPSVLRVRNTDNADASLKLECGALAVERRDPLLATHCRTTMHVPSTATRTDVRAVDAAARFHMHLYRKHPTRPFAGQLGMELYKLDPASWTRTSENLLVKGRVRIVDDSGGGGAGEKSGQGPSQIYAVVLRNDSDVDLWPYLAYMDADGYTISMVYHPDPAGPPPLRRHSRMVIGSGATESEALSFALADGAESGAGFLKLFVSTVYTPMTILEQGAAVGEGITQLSYGLGSKSRGQKVVSDDALWDTLLASVLVVRASVLGLD